jgi:tRNA nucleotidyltransferase (CCA-adding enzyme)
LFHQLHQENLRTSRSAQEVLSFFNQADAWRKPERLKKALLAEQVIGSDIQQWQTLLEAALAVDAGAIAKTMATGDGSKIQSAVAASRLQAIAACL